MKFSKVRLEVEEWSLISEHEFHLIKEVNGVRWEWKNVKSELQRNNKEKLIKTLKLIKDDAKNKKISEELGVSNRSVSRIRKELREKNWISKDGKITLEGEKELIIFEREKNGEIS